MIFVDQTYITIARNTEATYHEKKVAELERNIKQLTEALAWEHEQHRSRLIELEKVERQVALKSEQAQPKKNYSTLKPLPSSTQKWSQVRKYHRPYTRISMLPKAG